MNKQNSKKKIVRRQPKKDSRGTRVNFDNTRVKKFDDDIEGKVKITPPMQTCKSNDIKWYALNNELLNSAGRFTFYNVLGNKLPYQQTTSDGVHVSVPGVLSLKWCPYVGGVNNLAVNQSAKSVYSYVVHANSRNTSYSYQDLFMVILAAADIFAEISNLIRAYGVMTYYNGQNKFLPSALIEAMGINFKSARENYSHMLYDINNLIAQSRQLWIPKDLPFIERWFWLNAHIYKDAESTKSQLYMFTSSHKLTIQEMESETGTMLTYSETTPANPMNWDAKVSTVQTMIDALINSEDRGVIMGDILKAYTADRIFALNEVALDYVVTPVYDREVLTQIENATIWGTAPVSVTQDPDTDVMYTDWNVPSTPYTEDQLLAMGILGIDNVVLNFHQLDAPTPEQIMIATRLMISGASAFNTDSGTTYVPYSAGTELLISAVSYFYRYASNGETLYASKLPLKSSAVNFSIPEFCRWSAYDWAPAMYVLEANKINGFTVVPSVVVTEWDNYTILNKEELARIHTTAIFSEFNVPTLL